MTTELDSFERHLLADLRAEIESRPHGGPERRRQRRRRRAGVAGATAAVLTGGGWVGVGLLATPAYAVEEGPGGVIEVRINRLEDAEGLEQALEERGVPAEVDYLGTDLGCAEGRFREQPDRSLTESGAPSRTRVSVGEEHIEVTLDPRDLGPRVTVVIAASTLSPLGPGPDGVVDEGGVYGEVALAAGPVAPCVAVPLPPRS